MTAVKAMLQAVAALSQSAPVVLFKLGLKDDLQKSGSTQPAEQSPTTSKQQQQGVQAEGSAAAQQQQLPVGHLAQMAMQQGFSNMAVAVQLLPHLLHLCLESHSKLGSPVDMDPTLVIELDGETGGVDFYRKSPEAAAGQAAYKDALYSATICLKVLSRLLCDAAAVYDHPSVTFAAQDIDQLTYVMQAAEVAVRVIAVTTRSQRHLASNDLLQSASDSRYAAFTYATDLVDAATTFVEGDASPAQLLDTSPHAVQQPRLQMVQQLVSLRATAHKLDLVRLTAGVCGGVVEPKAFSHMWLLGDAERVTYHFKIDTRREVLELAGQLLCSCRGPVLPHGMLLVRQEARAEQQQQQQQQDPTGSAPVSFGQESPQLAQVKHQVPCKAVIHAACRLHTMGQQLHAVASRPDAPTAHPWRGLALIAQLNQLTTARLVDGRVEVRSRADAADDATDAQSPSSCWLNCSRGFFEAQQCSAAAASSSSGESCRPAIAGNPSGTPDSNSSSSTGVDSKGSRGLDVSMKAASGKASSSSHHDGSVSPESLTAAGPDDLMDDAQPGPDQEPSLATAASTASSISLRGPVVTGSTSGWQQGSQSSMMAGSQQQPVEPVEQSQGTNSNHSIELQQQGQQHLQPNSQQQKPFEVTNPNQHQQQQQQQGQQHLQHNRSGVAAQLHSSCHQAGSASNMSAEGLAAAAEVVAGCLFPAATAVKQKVEDWIEELNGEYAGQHNASSSPPIAEVQLLAAALQAAARAMFAAVPNRYGCNNPACTNLTTVSDAFALVRGKSCVCGGCWATWKLARTLRGCQQQGGFNTMPWALVWVVCMAIVDPDTHCAMAWQALPPWVPCPGDCLPPSTARPNMQNMPTLQELHGRHQITAVTASHTVCSVCSVTPVLA